MNRSTCITGALRQPAPGARLVVGTTYTDVFAGGGLQRCSVREVSRLASCVLGDTGVALTQIKTALARASDSTYNPTTSAAGHVRRHVGQASDDLLAMFGGRAVPARRPLRLDTTSRNVPLPARQSLCALVWTHFARRLGGCRPHFLRHAPCRTTPDCLFNTCLHADEV